MEKGIYSVSTGNVRVVTVEQAYQLIANEVLAFVGDQHWIEAGGHYRTLLGSVDGSWWRKSDDGIDERGMDVPRDITRAAFAAARFLRDNLLASTGDRIWGLTFTLYPDGKFKIEYDYNKPEGYEETDETISLEEALKGLPGQSA
jgi:hypothetical protein